MPEYKRPPIIESVIELRFGDRYSESDIQQLSKRLAKDYPTFEELSNFSVNMTHAAPRKLDAKTEYAFLGHKRISINAESIAMVNIDSLAYSRLAPYPGWIEFKRSFVALFQTAKATLEYKKIVRIGMRYINRIDIPLAEGQSQIRVENFIKYYPEAPQEIDGSYGTFAMQGQIKLNNAPFLVTLRLASTPSPLPNFLSVIFDIDVSLDHDVPQIEDDIAMMLDTMRDQKNWLFEACITDETRRLFAT